MPSNTVRNHLNNVNVRLDNVNVRVDNSDELGGYMSRLLILIMNEPDIKKKLEENVEFKEASSCDGWTWKYFKFNESPQAIIIETGRLQLVILSHLLSTL